MTSSINPDFEEEKSWFEKYINNFYKPDNEKYNENIELKRYHSIKVSERMNDLSAYLKLDIRNTNIAKITGLYHDIGRFTQYRDYNTFSDDESLYHGDLGVKVLKTEQRPLRVTSKEFEDILTAIYNHGLPELESISDPGRVRLCKMIRDADKMDIFRIVDNYNQEILSGKRQNRNVSLELGLKNKDKISKKVMDAFMQGKIVLKSDMEFINDFKLLQIAWIYDMNYNFTKKYVLESGHLENIINTISSPAEREKIYQKVLSDIKNS